MAPQLSIHVLSFGLIVLSVIIYVGSDKDPNWARKRDLPDWHFPKKKQETISILIKDLMGNGFLRIFYFMQRYFDNQTNLNGKNTKPEIKKSKNNKRSKLVALCFYSGVFTLLTLTHQWHLFIYLWLIPFFTVLPMLLRLRQLNEHYGLERQHDFNMSRNYTCRWFEKFLFAPHNVHYHLDHHLFMSVPFYQLPKLNQILKKHPEFNSLAHESVGVLSNHPKSILSELAVQRS